MRYIVGVLAVVLVAFLAIFMLSSGSGNKKNTSTANKAPAKLIDYVDKNSKVTLTTGGRVVGEDQYRSIRITISKDDRAIDVLAGYERVTEKTMHFSNTPAAYDVFLRALTGAGFSLSKVSTVKDERGLCPLGSTYIYELHSGSENIQRSWSTSCGGSATFGGTPILVRQLFQGQIPDYSKFVSTVKL